jgi:hypothetical protein
MPPSDSGIQPNEKGWTQLGQMTIAALVLPLRSGSWRAQFRSYPRPPVSGQPCRRAYNSGGNPSHAASRAKKNQGPHSVKRRAEL